MKKIIVAMLVIAMMLTACGGNNVVDTASDETIALDETVAPTESDNKIETEVDHIADSTDVTVDMTEPADGFDTNSKAEEKKAKEAKKKNENDATEPVNNATEPESTDNEATEPEKTEPETKPVETPKTGPDGDEKEETTQVPSTEPVVEETKPESEPEVIVTEPPVTEPIENEPPATEPPATEPPTTEPSKENGDAKDDNAPYDGDTAVPPDVENNNGSVKECVEHDMELIDTKLNASYQLYNYVTDYFTCKNCGYSETSIHIASANVSDSTISSAESSIVSYVNQLRVAHGLPELWTNGDWNSWADTRAKELSSSYGHVRPGGGSWLRSSGAYYTIAENIAAGQASGVGFYDAFYGSTSHRGAMLDPEAVGIAVGIYVDENGATYCAMVIVGPY